MESQINYDQVAVIAGNEYELIHRIFNRYAEQYKENQKNAEVIDRDHNLLYDSTKNPKPSAKAIITEKTDLKNWDKKRLNQLIENWNRVIAKLENIKAPSIIQESAKGIKKDLIDQIKSLQKQKTKSPYNQSKRNQILEKLKQSKERTKGVER